MSDPDEKYRISGCILHLTFFSTGGTSAFLGRRHLGTTAPQAFHVTLLAHLAQVLKMCPWSFWDRLWLF